MALLCFVLDLRSLSPPVLRDLKQSLFQLANYYAVSLPKINNGIDGGHSSAKALLDRIGICYVSRDRVSCADELKIAYNPHGNFNLRDLHHALNNVPTDAFSLQSSDSGALCRDLKLVDILSEESLYTWGGHDKNIARKVISISSSLTGALNSETIKALMDASDKNVIVELIFLERTLNHHGGIDQLVKQIDSLKNCSFQSLIPDLQVLHGLVKRWLRELIYDREEPLQASFIFKTNLMSSMNQISCNLCASFNPMVDEFFFCETCRCHGIPLGHSNMKANKSLSCPVTSDDLGDLDIVENSVRVGEQTILYMPSFQGCSKLKKIASPIDFDVIQRTNLVSLCEGLLMGAAYFVIPSTFSHSDDNNSELNNQVFQVVCNVLNSLDQGLVCSSNCNIETGMETSFKCYYILLPTDKRLMLLRRLSALEEFMPIPDVSQLTSCVVDEEIKNTVQDSFLKIEINDYNPIQHERGFHKKLNFLVKESLQFGALPLKSKGNSECPDLDTNSPKDDQSSVITENKLPLSDAKQEQDKSASILSEEWEKLIVNELGVIMHSPTCNPVSKLDQAVMTSPSQNNNSRQLDEKTSRILERLEIPRQLKRKAVSPGSLSSDVCAPVKKPLIPYKASDVSSLSSQLLKPSFQRIKRKG
ncbi:meiosis 1 arrest protein [Striga asiatica]|uniref:Meiosis 1 arrest protein n=1 Tax=Striga asiatica TaxID=4170 RepID=A0A5A7QUR8_STRAF|nr:meiosis 1 arrest protein [Striga asiatica]